MPPDAVSPFAALSVARETTVDRVLTELRRAIFEGDLEPGTPLREVALAESLAVSRSTVREALALLVADGLATRVPNKGTTVRAPEAEAIRDVSRARTVIETAGVRCWGEAPEERRQVVRDRLAAYESAARGRPTNAVLNEAHLSFHQALVALAGSERLLAAEVSLCAEIRLALAKVNRHRDDAVEQVATHTYLVELLESGATEAAVEELVRHIADGRDSMLEELGLVGSGPVTV